MDSQARTLRLLFFPLMAPGHILPMVDVAKLFAARGVEATVLTTPANATLVRPSVESDGHPVRIVLVPFPSVEHGLPEGCENLSSIPNEEMRINFLEAVFDLRGPFGGVLRDLRPDCVVTDTFLPWTHEAAADLGIPRLVFHGMSLFALCAKGIVERHKPHENSPSGDESFVIPGLPHRIEMLKSQVPKFHNTIPVFVKMVSQIEEFEPKSYGVVANSFYELEQDYVEHYRKMAEQKTWQLGPVSLCNNDIVDKCTRGSTAMATDQDMCLNWLKSKSPGSVVYVCFGSMSEFSSAQLQETAVGLEAAGHPFVWVVRSGGGDDWIPEGFEERIGEKGLVIRGWAPQILILGHGSIGGFVTHCGWNSCLEGITAGLPLVTWPLFAEQFYNERLIVDVLEIGVSVGVKAYEASPRARELVEAAAIKTAVNRVMGGGDEAAERRRKAKAIGEMAGRAVERGGSSYGDLSRLIQELKDRRNVTI